MKQKQTADNPHPETKKASSAFLHWPTVGQRIIKTSIAVTLCLFFYMLRGYQGESLPAEAAITAIICMQPYMNGTRENALTRLAGTVIGAVWGFLFLLMMLVFPTLGKSLPVLYLLMGLGTLISLHSALLVRLPDASGLAAIVFVCVVIAYPDISNPMDQAFHRILDVLVGTVIALGVNACRIPRRKQKGQVFFVRMKDLAADQFSNLSPAVLFRLQYLFQEGARICLMSEHAPAFQTSQLGRLKFNVPMIVMDGAAIYDANENTYLATTGIDHTAFHWLAKRLEAMGVSYFVYTVHRDRNCIYHHGEMTGRERVVYQHMKRSPYRYYLDDDHYAVSDVVSFKIVTSREEAERIRRELQPSVEKMKLRAVIRPQAGLEDGVSLYFYALHADLPHAQAHLMQLLRQDDPGCEMRNMVPERYYRTERDAIRLLREVTNAFAPTVFTVWLRDHRAKQEAKRAQRKQGKAA